MLHMYLHPQVIKATPSGGYVPEPVPGVMLPTPDGEEEAFVPADLIKDTETLLTSGSAQQPVYVDSPIQDFAPVCDCTLHFVLINAHHIIRH